MKRSRVLRSAFLISVLSLLTAPAHALLEGSFLYFPTHTANESKLTEWKINGALVGYTRTVSSPRGIWLILHGNGGQASNRQYIVDLLPADTSVYVLEYPGYGLRPGTPSMKTINAAAQTAYADLRALHPGIPVGVLGESLGSGPASFLCSSSAPPDRLVLMVPYDNLLSVAKKHINYLPVGLLMRDKWDNVKALSAYKGRIDIFGAVNDTIIPITHARNLAKTVPHARYVELPCGHGDWSHQPEAKITD
jgi:pimeloyl-ACP methyl ester carboxylesterase